MMIADISKAKFFVKPGATDMRKQINGLAVLTQEDLELDPYSGNLFLFCNKAKKLLKILYWDRNGFCLWMKRLEKGKFPWPQTSQEAKEISQDQLKMLLDGIDFWNAHEKISYTEVA